VDTGVSPGLSNMMAAYGAGQLDRADRAEIYVGGLPRERTWPYQYKAPFAPSDVIEEYTRPARLRENGKLVVRPALSEPELMDFAGVGTLEAFNTDGCGACSHPRHSEHEGKTLPLSGAQVDACFARPVSAETLNVRVSFVRSM
jgi:saccharopine dehydrogenase-like NADP-dependent oxidoreductase